MMKYIKNEAQCFITRWNTEKRNKMILEEEIKDEKMSSFSSDFQMLIKH